MVHHLWYGSFDEEVGDVRARPWRNATIRRPPPRRGGARRAVGRALIGLGEWIAPETASSNQAVGE